MVFALLLAAAADPAPGAELYRTQCARCHGKAGEGVAKKYAKPLYGSLSVPQLSAVVQKTMPENDPGSLSKAESDAIAQFMNDAFYSPIARERSRPARVELSRLTVAQYRRAVADVLAGFRGAPPKLEFGGLKGEYFATRNFGNRQFERPDAGVKFDFGTARPFKEPEKKGGKDENANEFSARWTGSVFAPDTGEYGFVVKSDQAVGLWVNDERIKVIDAQVKSGKQTEYTASVPLTGGRAYGIKLEFSKALQGVKDKNPKPVPAFVELHWQRPGGVIEVIPARYLSKQFVPEQHVVAAKFPPDDRSLGWERGTTVSKDWDAAATEAALAAATYVVKFRQQLAGVDPKQPAEKQLDAAKKFAGRFAERAFRRPLTPAQQSLYVDRQFTAAGADLDAGLKRSVVLVLKSPRFLYREAAGDPDGYAAAAKLAFALWDSVPDAELLQAAAKNELKTPEQLRKHALRMAADPRAKAKLHSFLLHWLKLDHAKDLAKDPKKFPGFDAAAANDLRTSLDLVLDGVINAEKDDFRNLFRGETVPLTEPLAKLYGATWPGGTGFQPVALDAGKRAGVLTHPYLLAANAYFAESSPIHRGVFLARGIFGTQLQPPAEAFSPLAPDLHPNLTTRERVALQTKGANCQTCHTVINAAGFTLEAFDAIGKFRATDRDKAVDTTGEYLARDGKTVPFAGPLDVAKYAADSPDVHAAFAEQMFHHLVAQPVRAYGPDTGAELRAAFARGGYSIRNLAAEIAVTSAAGPRVDKRVTDARRE